MNRKVLLVDDEPNVLAALRRVLGERFLLHCAGSGAEALAMEEAYGPFGAMVSDMRMPGMDGLALLREMRKRAPETVRMVLSGHADLNAVIAAVNEGAVFRFHTKPVPPEVLRTSIENALLKHEIEKRLGKLVEPGDPLLSEASELRRALAEDELRMYLQPQIRIADRSVASVEALVRWAHPQRGLLVPGQFLHVADAAGLLGEITGWMLHAACKEVRRGNEHGFSPSQIAVNVTAADLADADFPLRIRNLLDVHRLPAAQLELELTEGAAIVDLKRCRVVLDDLAGLGIGLSLDDFGTGYSTFGWLHQLPFSKLKIDRTFIQEIAHDQDAYRIVETIITLARRLGMKVVAEGVETEAQMGLLVEAGCDLAQGFLIARPMMASLFAGWHVGNGYERSAEDTRRSADGRQLPAKGTDITSCRGDE